ncbi:fimbria/pilus outer membrane usher protein [Pantoea dispersa]
MRRFIKTKGTIFNAKKSENKKNNYKNNSFSRSIKTACYCIITCSSESFAQLYFNPELLKVAGDDYLQNEYADLSPYEMGSQAPGDYRVKVFINDRYVGDQNVTFITGPDNELLPVFTREQYDAFGVRTSTIEGLATLPHDASIENIRAYIPSARSDFIFADQRLNLSIPQLMMQRRARGEADPASWDQGLPAALLNYAITGNHTRGLSGVGSSESLYANLRGGFNLGAWRLRSYATGQQRSSSGKSKRDFNVISTYLQRDIHSIKGQLILGDAATPGEVFDSVQFRGGQLVSDDAMLPNSLRGFAPVIRGVSESGAEVTIRQNNSVIYQSYVPPGPFEINDLYPASLSGDLEVTIKENDGSERTFSQPYSSVAIMQREGQAKYAFVGGRLQSGGGNREPIFVQGTIIYGLPRSITLYGGVQATEKYGALSAGVGVSLGHLGALSADVTQSSAKLPSHERVHGQSYRLRYSRSILETGTSVSLAAYRYSTAGYYSLQDTVTQSADGTGNGLNSRYRPRSEFQLMLNQSLGDAGSLYVTGSQRDYWSKQGALQSWTLGYNTSLWGTNLGVNFTQAKDTDTGRQDSRLALNVSVPLSRWLPGGESRYRPTMNLNYGLVDVKNHGTSQQLGLSGTALQGSQLSYNVSHSQASKGEGSSSLSAAYRGSSGTLSAGYNRSAQQEQVNYGLRGGIVAHPYGITLSQELSETVALVRAPGASGVNVNNQTGVATDWRGYAVVPYVTPYRRTEVSLEPTNLKANVALNNTSTGVVPTRGAVVLADYPTQHGRQVLMTVTQQNGQPVPFGAIALLENSDESNPTTGIVADEGLLYMTGLPETGQLTVQWGKGENTRCSIPFSLSSPSDDNTPAQMRSVCQRIDEKE